MAQYSSFQTLLPDFPDPAGPINVLLFLDRGAFLASGGDDHFLRLWDIRSGILQQTLNDLSWGQITNLSALETTTGFSLFVGTARGVVSVFPWNSRAKRLNNHSGTSTNAFGYNIPVESQAVDHINSKFCVASAEGQIKMYSIQEGKVLVFIWSFNMDSSIPRSIDLVGRGKETLAVHTLKTGMLRCYDSQTAKIITEEHLQGATGFVTYSPDERLKAIHDLSTDSYKLYDNVNPTTSVVCLTPAGTSRRIKGSAFGEDGRILVCGGDDGLVYVYDVGLGDEIQRLQHPDDSTVCAVTTYSSEHHHFIASAESESPAKITIWAKPVSLSTADASSSLTEHDQSAARELEDREIATEQRDRIKRAAEAARVKARVDKELANKLAEDDIYDAKVNKFVVFVWLLAGLVLTTSVAISVYFHRVHTS
ncbi:WD40-repeat-containing domain protein [Mycena filopes]|nr:WD40-repeat-containing domain protein [Mycena filopes]